MLEDRVTGQPSQTRIRSHNAQIFHWSTVNYTALNCAPLYCTALHCTIALHCTSLHYTALDCTCSALSATQHTLAVCWGRVDECCCSGRVKNDHVSPSLSPYWSCHICTVYIDPLYTWNL